jgi:phage gp36-like protein
MSTQTYCTKSDLEAIWPPASVTASVDDDGSGTLSPTESSYIDRAIERAANFINARLEMRYRISDLAANTWCRDANAAIAAFWLSTRRGDAAPPQLQQQYDAYLVALTEIAAGRLKVPQQIDSIDTSPGLTNFAIDLSQPKRKAQVVDETSV